MAPADNRLSLPSKSLIMANQNPNLYPTTGNGSNNKTLNHPPAHYNRNNNSLRQFCDWLDKTEKNNPNASCSSSIPTSAMEIEELEADSILSKSEVLTREEVLKRRSIQMKRLIKLYKEHYWTMMEELKSRHKDYYWEYGTSPFQDDEGAGGVVDGYNNSLPGTSNNNGSNNFNKSVVGFNGNRCEVHSCKLKPMALTRFCFAHILSDSKQKLYKGCSYVIKSLPNGPVYCMKPVLRSTVPLLCSMHLGKAEKHVTKALKKAGHIATSKSKPAPKIHIVLAEFVCHIVAKRKMNPNAIVEAVED
ncbi:INO80 complex subunit D-like [Impatiens glandulifera]|uniref:INO80 complex subunit D-like n=1 Tax=Impatiens glandulifera TaxID=253017 RepID=UPI001FB1642A|nr:INO80 complex subunit D-like [Impatiens glandulifera]XP_047331379.1 INO80 complex subunit D-like [Impatiens glandulifera]